MIKDEKRLQFEQADPATAQRSMGVNKQVNPLRLVERPQAERQAQREPAEQTGRFSNDYLSKLPEPSGKKINKSGKDHLYKTRMCIHGIECRRKLVCTYAHSQRQLRKPFKNRKKPCVLYQMGRCDLGAACNDYHGNMDLKKANYKYKVEVCQAFLEGHCPYGEVCIRKHEVPEQQEPERLSTEEDVRPKQVAHEEGKEHDEEQAVKKEGKEVVEEVEEKIAEEECIVQDGFSFNFTA